MSKQSKNGNGAVPQNNPQRNARSTLRTQLVLSVKGLAAFSLGLVSLAEIAPERVTASQLSFFLMAALADLGNNPATFTDIKEDLGPVIGKSLHTTYKVFLTDEDLSTKSRQAGMGWLTLEVDRADRRRRYLRLTDKGLQVLSGLNLALKGDQA